MQNIDGSNKNKDMIFLLKLTIFVLVVKFCVGAAYYNIFVSALRKPIYAFDGEAYSIVGWYIALVLKGVNIFALPVRFIPTDYAILNGFYGTIAIFYGNLPPMESYGVGLYSYIMGVFYYIFGYAPVLFRFLCSVLSVLSAFLAYDIARQNFNDMAGKITFIIMLIMPSFFVYSVSLQRDTLINFFILLGAHQILRLAKAQRVRTWVFVIGLAAIVALFLYYLRVTAMLVFVAFALTFFYIKLFHRFKWAVSAITVSVFAIPTLGGHIIVIIKSVLTRMLSYHLGFSLQGGYFFKLLPARYYDEIRAGVLNSQIGLLDFLTAYFNGLKAFFFQPSPFGMYKIQHIAAVPEIIVWYSVVIFAFFGIVDSIKSLTIQKAALIALLFLFTSSIGMSEANVETLIRHRDMIVAVYIIFAARGIQMVKDKMRTEKVI